MSDENTQAEAVPMAMVYNYKDDIRDELVKLIKQCDHLRVVLDNLSTERGVPIKNTVIRVNKGREMLQSALDYWQYDVIQGNTPGTKAERQKQEQYDLS